MHNLLRVNDFHSTGNWASRKEADVVSFLFQTAVTYKLDNKYLADVTVARVKGEKPKVTSVFIR